MPVYDYVCLVLCGDFQERLVDSFWVTQLLPEGVRGLLGFREAGNDSYRLFIGSKRLKTSSGLLQSVAEREVTPRCGLQLDRARKVRDCFGEFPLLLREQAKTEPGIELVGIVLERLLVAGLRALVIA